MKFIKMYEDVEEPAYETLGSSGMDIKLYSRYKRDVNIYSGTMLVVSTGLKVEIPIGYEIQVRSRSGLAFKNGVVVLNSPGTIDSDYKGEIKVCLFNHGPVALNLKHGDRIAQLVYAKVIQATSVVTKDFDRGEGGFGSTGL